MKTYSIIIERRAMTFISKLPADEKERVLRSIAKLPSDGDIKPMKGIRYRGYYRLRVGNYRIVYRKDDAALVVCVVDAGNRGQIYKRY